MGSPTLAEALGYLSLLAELRPGRVERAAVRWHGKLETEAPLLTLAEAQLALVALAPLCAGDREAVGVLRRLLRRVRPDGRGFSEGPLSELGEPLHHPRLQGIRVTERSVVRLGAREHLVG